MRRRSRGVAPWLRGNAVEIGLFLLALWPALYFNNGANIPQVSRLDAIYSFVEPGTPDTGSFRIDRFVRNPGRGANTIDWAMNPAWSPSAYSNKAPGLQIAAVPVYAALYHGYRGFGGLPEAPGPTYVLAWLLNVWVQGLLGALLAPVFYRLVRDAVGLSPFASASLALVLWFGTGLAPFHTQLWGHTAAAALVGLALYALVREAPAWAGALIGVGVLFDYSLVIPLASFAGWLVWRSDARALGRFALGGLPALAVYAAYHQACFGNPILPALSYNNPLFAPASALGGTSRLPEALWGLSFSPYRGLFFFWPVCGVLFAALALARRLAGEPLFWLALANAALFFAANAAFNGWHGGSTLGPRYQIPALPFYGLLGALVVRELGKRLRDRRRLRRAALASAGVVVAVSVSNAFLGQAISPLAPDVHLMPGPPDGVDWTRPLAHYYGLLGRGELQPHPLIPIRTPNEPETATRLRAWNVGGLMGLSGTAAALPFVAVATAGAAWTLRRAARLTR